MFDDYEIKKVKKTSKLSETHEFKNPEQQKQKKNKKKKSSNTFWDVPQQYTDHNNSNLSYDYLELEKKLKIEIDKWGVDSVSNQLLELIKENYQQYKKQHQYHQMNTLFNSFFPAAKKNLKQGYEQARKVLPPLDQDIEKLLIATYSKSIEKLETWIEKKQPTEEANYKQSKIPNPTNEKLIKKISNLLIEQGIYLEEQKVHHPIINTKR